MHQFSELVFRSASFTLGVLEEVESKLIEQLRTAVRLFLLKSSNDSTSKAITAVGMFSLFESILQDGLACRNGFKKRKTF